MLTNRPDKRECLRGQGVLLPRLHALILMFLVLAAAHAPVAADEVRSMALSGGVFNFNKTATQAEGGIEFRFPTKTWKLVSAFGFTLTEKSSYYVFGGLRRDFGIGHEGWQLTPAFGISLYEQGDGKDLGGPIEFRSALEISHQWANENRLAFAIYHLSNASIYDLNPGANSLILTFSFPL